MHRRSFIKTTASAGMLTLIAPNSILNLATVAGDNNLRQSFTQLPDTARPYTWWHWMNGNVTREGITLDLEAMKRVGLGGFQLFDAGTGIVKGSIEYLSPQWSSLMLHTIAESRRLGLEFAMHNCPGWSSSGGPWITPEYAMQQLTWSEILIDSRKKSPIIPQLPSSNMGFYKDIAIVAFPSGPGEEPIAKLISRADVNGKKVEIKSIIGQNEKHLLLKPPPEGNEASLTLKLKKTVIIGNITLFTGALQGGGLLKAEVSVDGITFEKLGHFTGGSDNFSQEGAMPATLSFGPRDARFLRIISSIPRSISHLTVCKSAKNTDWLYKANYRNAGWDRKGTGDGSQNVIQKNQILDLTSKFNPATGILNWDAPPGQWRILRIGHTSIGKLNHSAPTTGTGLECDKFSKDAFGFHFERMFSALLEPLQGLAAQGKVGLLIDSYEMGQQNWTSNLPEEFSSRRGYSILPLLPALTGRIITDQTVTDNFLTDFRDTCADMMADNYYGEFARLCKKNDIISYTEPYGSGPYREMQAGLKTDIVMGEFWAGHTVLWENNEMIRTVKLAASIAHAKNNSIVGAEAFTAEPGSGKWQQYPYSMKALGDWMFTQGLTRIFFHRFAHQPHPTAAPGMTMGPWGIHFDRTNTWFEMGKQWITYLTRTQYILQQGRFVADIAYIATEEPDISVPTMPNQLIVRPPKGYDFDIIPLSMIKESHVENSCLVTSSGNRYRVLVLSGDTSLSPEILHGLSGLASKGLPIIGHKPIRFDIQPVESLATQKALVAEIWSQPNVYEAIDPVNVLITLGSLPDFKYTSISGDAPISYIHRSTENQDFFFIANRRRTTETLQCSFRTRGNPEIWDADSGISYKLPFFSYAGGYTNVPLVLPPAGSLILAFDKNHIPKDSIIKIGGHGQVADCRVSNEETAVPTIHTTFCILLWIKPETDIPVSREQFFGKKRTDHYTIYPWNAQKLYGPDKATAGLSVGRNGVVLFERAGEEFNDILSVEQPISGWTHLAISYNNNQPSIYINGILAASGEISSHIVFPGTGPAKQEDGASYYNGDMTNPQIWEHLPSFNALQNLIAKGREKDNSLQSWEYYPVDNNLLFNHDGIYNISFRKKGDIKLKVSGTGTVSELANDWKVFFPEHSGAPSSEIFPKLLSLHLHKNPAIKYFSGTASYEKKFTLDTIHNQKMDRYFIDLGKVEVIAEIYLNGTKVSTLWKPPYKAEITSLLKEGENLLLVKVANLWPNRLIGDEHLPEENSYQGAAWKGKFNVLAEGAIKELPIWYKNGTAKPNGGRITFTTWKHYKAGDPLIESGLIGPVSIHKGMLYPVF